MKYQNIEVQPIAGALGAEISGVDLSKPLSDEVFQDIHQALMDHLVIFFRGQELTPVEHINFISNSKICTLDARAPKRGPLAVVLDVEVIVPYSRGNSKVCSPRYRPFTRVKHSQAGTGIW